MKLYHRSLIRKLFNAGVGFVAEYPADTASSTITHQASPEAADRPCLIILQCTETFATNGGTKPTFKVGQTGTVEKFIAAATIAALTIGQKLVVVGTLSSAADLIVTATVGVGAGTGAIKLTTEVFTATLP